MLMSRRDAIAAIAAALAVSACDGTEREPGTLVIASSPTGVPFSFVDPMTNELTGSMVDTALAVCRLMGRKPKLVITPFPALIPSLVMEKVDLVAAAILRTPEREQVVDFSDPVYAYAGALVVRERDNRRYPDLHALAGRRVGAQAGTRFVAQLEQAGASVTTYDGLSDILRDIDNRRIEFGYGDEPILRYQLRVGPRREVRIAEGFTPPAREKLCLVVRKGDPDLAQINSAIASMRARILPAIAKQWGLG